MDYYNDLIVYGCAYTPKYDEDESTIFNHTTMNSEFAQSVIGLPVYIEHDTTVQIGEVKEAFINERRQLMVVLHIIGNPLVNKLLPSRLYKDPSNGNKGFFNALSLGNSVGFKLTDYGDYKVKEIAQNVPSEISIVRAGNRPMTQILEYWMVPDSIEDVESYIQEKLGNDLVRYH